MLLSHTIYLLWCPETLVINFNKLEMSHFTCSEGTNHLWDAYADVLNIKFLR